MPRQPLLALPGVVYPSECPAVDSLTFVTHKSFTYHGTRPTRMTLSMPEGCLNILRHKTPELPHTKEPRPKHVPVNTPGTWLEGPGEDEYLSLGGAQLQGAAQGAGEWRWWAPGRRKAMSHQLALGGSRVLSGG